MSIKVSARLRAARMVVVTASILLGVIAACDKSNPSAGGDGGHGGRGAQGGAGGVGAAAGAGGGGGGAGGEAFCASGTVVYAQPGCGADAVRGCVTGEAGACGSVYCGCDGVLRVEACAYGVHPYAYRSQAFALDPQHPDCDPNTPPSGPGGGAGGGGAAGGAAGAIRE